MGMSLTACEWSHDNGSPTTPEDLAKYVQLDEKQVEKRMLAEEM
jgi:hypothetical protein